MLVMLMHVSPFMSQVMEKCGLRRNLVPLAVFAISSNLKQSDYSLVHDIVLLHHYNDYQYQQWGRRQSWWGKWPHRIHLRD
jgi:hypothetical protein